MSNNWKIIMLFKVKIIILIISLMPLIIIIIHLQHQDFSVFPQKVIRVNNKINNNNNNRYKSYSVRLIIKQPIVIKME